MIRARLIRALLGMILACPALSHAEWSSSAGHWYRYPLPGAEVKSLVADPNVPDGFYAGTAQGGIYRSTDGARTWTSSPGGSPYPGYSVTSLAIDPLQGSTLWVGLTGVVRGGILARSDDRGQTFFEVKRWDERAAARVVAVSVQGGRRLLAVGGDYGVELSDDGGTTWRISSPALDPGSGISFLAFHPRKETLLYCGSFRHPFLSTDLGRTWKRIANGMIEDTEVFALDFSSRNPDDFWAATCGWVYRTIDGARSWTRYKNGLTDRRTHVVRTDPLDPTRVLAGTTGGLFESRDSGASFHRIGPEIVVNAITFDPRHPGVLLIGTEAEGILRSEDGGLTLQESNRGLAEARVSSVATTVSGRVIVSRAADGASGGLWTIDPKTGDTEKLLPAPPSTVLGLSSVGEALLAGTPDGIYRCDGPGRPWTAVLGRPTRGFAADGSVRVLAATEAGVYESRDQGRSWGRMGSLTGRVDGVTRARFTGLGITTMAAESGGRTLWWDGREWVFQAVKADGGRRLTGGFGRPRASLQWKPEPIGLEIDSVRSLLFFRPADESADGIALRFPEAGLSVAGWSGDPRGPEGLYLATIGRGLFRFVPTPTIVTPELPVVPVVASQRSGMSR